MPPSSFRPPPAAEWLQERLDRLVKKAVFPSCSEAIQSAVEEKLDRISGALTPSPPASRILNKCLFRVTGALVKTA